MKIEEMQAQHELRAACDIHPCLKLQDDLDHRHAASGTTVPGHVIYPGRSGRTFSPYSRTISDSLQTGRLLYPLQSRRPERILFYNSSIPFLSLPDFHSATMAPKSSKKGSDNVGFRLTIFFFLPTYKRHLDQLQARPGDEVR